MVLLYVPHIIIHYIMSDEFRTLHAARKHELDLMVQINIANRSFLNPFTIYSM